MDTRRNPRSTRLRTVATIGGFGALGVLGTALLATAQAHAPAERTIAIASTSTVVGPVAPVPHPATIRPLPHDAAVVVPASVTAGTDLTVRGTGCRQGGRPGQASVSIGDDRALLAGATVPAGPDGRWSATVTVPLTVRPGTHPVRASCADGPRADRGFDHPRFVVTVSAPAARPATPVRVRPRYAG